MYQNTRLLTVLFLIIFAGGCKDDSVESDVKVLVQKEFDISMWEKLDGDTRKFQLNIKTIKPQFCENTLINVLPTSNEDQLAVSIQDIPAPDCPNPVFYATSNASLGILDIQNYNMEISLKNVIHNRGILEVTDDYYEIGLVDLDGIVIKENRLYKIPKNTIWGYVSFEDIDQAAAYDFMNEVKAICSARTYENGYYGYFSVVDNELSVLGEAFSHPNTKSFGFDFQENVNDLEAIISTYRVDYPNIEFKIFTSRGIVL